MNSARRFLALLDTCARALIHQQPALWTLGIAALLLIAVTPLTVELIVINKFPVDFTYPLDTALRWYHGHVPHRDYHAPVGAAYWLNQGVAIEIFGYSAKSLFWSNMIAACLIGGCGYIALHRRLSGGLAALFIIGMVELIVSPRLFGQPGGTLSYIAPYNKIGMAIIAVLICAFFLEARRNGRRFSNALESAGLIFLLIWLCYLKINFTVFVVIGGLVGLALAPTNWRLIIVTLVAGLVTAVGIGVATGIGAPYLEDVQATVAAAENIRWWKLSDDLALNVFTWGLSLVAIAAYIATSAAANKARLKNGIVAAGLLGASIVIMNQAYGTDFPLAFVALVVLAERALREDPPAVKIRLSAYAPALLIATALIAIPLIRDLQSMWVYVDDQRTGRLIRFCQSPDSPICTVSFNFFTPHALAALDSFPAPVTAPHRTETVTLNELGAAAMSVTEHLAICDNNRVCTYWSLYHELYSLLNRIIVEDDQPLVLGFMNILPYYYQLEPPRHVLAWFDIGRTLSERSHPPGEQIFSDVTLLVIPKTPHIPDYKAEMQPMYQTDIDRFFQTVVETEAWLIMRRAKREN